MQDWQRLLAEIRGARTLRQWSADLGIVNEDGATNGETVRVWLREDRPSKPSAKHLALVLQQATVEQAALLLAALGDTEREMTR